MGTRLREYVLSWKENISSLLIFASMILILFNQEEWAAIVALMAALLLELQLVEARRELKERKNV